MHTQSTNITLSIRSHVFIKQVYNSSPERWSPIHLVKMQKIKVDPLKAPILNFDVQLMLQTKQVITRFKFNLTAIANLANSGQGIKIVLPKSETFSLGDQNYQKQDRFYHFLHHRVWYNMYDIGNPGTYWRPSCFSHSVSQRQSLNFSRQSCLKKTLHIHGLSLP